MGICCIAKMETIKATLRTIGYVRRLNQGSAGTILIVSDFLNKWLKWEAYNIQKC